MPQRVPPPEVVLAGKRFVPLLDPATILARVAELGRDVNAHYALGEPPILMPLLKGALMFLGDLVPHMGFAWQICPLRISTYGNGMISTGTPSQLPLPDISVQGRRVLIIEDIVDSGNTLAALVRHLDQLGAAEVRIVSLLFKPQAFRGQVKPDWIGFDIPDAFVIGYGMDFDEQGRYLRAVYQLAA